MHIRDLTFIFVISVEVSQIKHKTPKFPTFQLNQDFWLDKRICTMVQKNFSLYLITQEIITFCHEMTSLECNCGRYLQNLGEALQYYPVLWFKLAHIIKTRSIWKLQNSSSCAAQEFSLASCVQALFQPKSQNNEKFGILDNSCWGSLVFCPLFAAFLFCHQGYSLANLAQHPGGAPRPSYQNLLTGGTPRP